MDKATKSKVNYNTVTEEVTKYDKLLKESTLGYVKAKIWGDGQLQAEWGVINDREITQVKKVINVKSANKLMVRYQTRKTEMANSFKKNGIQRCRLDTIIKLAMKKTWLSGTWVKDIEGMVIEEIPELELTDEGIMACALGEIKPMEGLGRRGGIEIVYEELIKELDIAKTKQKKISDGKRKTNDSAKVEIAMEIEDLEAQLKSCPYWTFRIIDQGE
jgi:hypothetical protein